MEWMRGISYSQVTYYVRSPDTICYRDCADLSCRRTEIHKELLLYDYMRINTERILYLADSFHDEGHFKLAGANAIAWVSAGGDDGFRPCLADRCPA